MTIALDPFMAGHVAPPRRPGDFRRNTQGTPQVSHPDGKLVKPKRKADPPRIATLSYSRPSGFGKIVEDTYSIQKWKERQEAYGFALTPELVERAQVLIDIEDRDSKEWKDEADKIVKAAKLAAKASIAADRGGHSHTLTEDDDEGRDIITRITAGEELGMPADVQHSLVAAWRAMLEREGLEILAIEMPVVNDTYRAAGTLDRVARLTRSLRFSLCTGEIVILPAGTVLILDIKTGQRRLNPNGTVMYWHSYAVQVFLYGPTSRPYDTETETRGEWPWELDGHWALIAHLDVLGALDGNPSCDLILVDLAAGRRAADLCVAAKQWATDTTVFSVAQLTNDCATCGNTGLITVGDGDYEGAGCHEEPCPNCDSVAQIVEGTMRGAGQDVRACQTTHAESAVGENPTPSTPDVPVVEADPVVLPTMVEQATEPATGTLFAGEGAEDDPAPSPVLLNPTVNDLLPRAGMPQHALDELEIDRLNEQRRWSYDDRVRSPAALTPDPARLAIVDARARLATNPAQGADLSDDEFAPLWDAVRATYDTLDPAARAWVGALSTKATQQKLSFHTSRCRTERTYNIARAIVALCVCGADNDEITRALLALVLGDVALFPGVAVGHLVGSLGVVEATRFAGLVDAYTNNELKSYTDESGVLRYRESVA